MLNTMAVCIKRPKTAAGWRARLVSANDEGTAGPWLVGRCDLLTVTKSRGTLWDEMCIIAAKFMCRESSRVCICAGSRPVLPESEFS
jgi:hypothetical protein